MIKIKKIIFFILCLPLAALAAKDVAPVTNGLYESECGACHMAYQPGLLSAASWRQLLASLDDHFSENAELNKSDLEQIRNYVLQNSADTSSYPVSIKIMKHRAVEANPLRVTDTAYIARLHRGINKGLKNNGGDGVSLGRCEVCHTHALEGSYSIIELRLPLKGH